MSMVYTGHHIAVETGSGDSPVSSARGGPEHDHPGHERVAECKRGQPLLQSRMEYPFRHCCDLEITESEFPHYTARMYRVRIVLTADARPPMLKRG